MKDSASVSRRRFMQSSGCLAGYTALRLSAPASNLAQDLYVSADLPTGRVMVKDENVCLHCGMCAERCPTAAWEMIKYVYKSAIAGDR